MSILKAENITFSYKKNTKLIRNINFRMDNNSIVGLFGDSGSGKTTFCKILSKFIPEYEGQITIDDRPADSKYNPVQLIYQHPEKVMNPRWNMRKILHESWKPPEEMLENMGIKKEWFERYPVELSGGELQRFSILRALNPKTEFIIADEITTMLDAVTQVQIWKQLIKYSREQNIGILAVSHDMTLLERVCDRILFFDDINNI